MAAGDIAGSLAESCDARMLLLHVVPPADQGQHHLADTAASVLDELAFRIGRLGVDVEKRTEVADEPAAVILQELSTRDHDLVVMGGIDRGHDGKLYVGKTIPSVLTKDLAPAILLVSHGRE
jgi:nucleotide-binding universal stress UspA family protein